MVQRCKKLETASSEAQQHQQDAQEELLHTQKKLSSAEKEIWSARKELQGVQTELDAQRATKISKKLRNAERSSEEGGGVY